MTEICQGRVESIYIDFFSQCHEKPKTYFYNNLKWQGNRSLSFFLHPRRSCHWWTLSVVVFSHLWCLQMVFPLCIYGVTLFMVISEIHLLGDPFVRGYGSIVMAICRCRQTKCSSVLSDDCWSFEHQCQNRRSKRLADPTMTARATASLAEN